MKIEDIFQNPKYIRYKILFDFIYSESKYLKLPGEKPGEIKLRHLRYLLCKKHGLKLDKYPGKKIRYDGEKDGMDIKEIVSDKYKFPNHTMLSRAIRKLIEEFNLIERVLDEKGKEYYAVTEYGFCRWQRDYIHMIIDKRIPDNPEVLEKLATEIDAFSLSL